MQSLLVSLWSETYLLLGEEINSVGKIKTYLLLSGAIVLPMQSKWSSEVDCRRLQAVGESERESGEREKKRVGEREKKRLGEREKESGGERKMRDGY